MGSLLKSIKLALTHSLFTVAGETRSWEQPGTGWMIEMVEAVSRGFADKNEQHPATWRAAPGPVAAGVEHGRAGSGRKDVLASFCSSNSSASTL